MNTITELFITTSHLLIKKCCVAQILVTLKLSDKALSRSSVNLDIKKYFYNMLAARLAKW